MNTMIETSRANIKEDMSTSVVVAAQRSIVDELIDDAILELCFEIHRAAKLGFLFPVEFTTNPDKLTQNSGKSGKATTKSVFCHVCGFNKGAHKFAEHLIGCLNGQQGYEANIRKARTKKMNFKECDPEDEDLDDYDPDAAAKKVQKKKKSASGKSKLLGNSLSKPSYNSAPSYMDMSIDEKKAFFNVKCGVVSKRTRKLCMNSLNCGSHSKMEQTSVRDDLLREMGDEPDNGQIDVDTVDEEISDIMPSYCAGDGSIPPIPAYSSGSSSFP